MRFRIIRLIVVGAAALTPLSVGSDSCDAGPILDWLFPNRAARRAARDGTVTFRVPVGTYQNQQFNRSGYAPTTSYRTVWAPVPVTQYRPVSYVNPLSTSNASALRPCTTYEWQARRVPYVSYQPFTQANSYAVAASSPATPATPWAPSPSSCCGTTSYYGATGSGAVPIATQWTTVGSGVSYAAPGATGLLSNGTVPATISAGYRNGEAFSPSSDMVQQYYQAPQASDSAPMCQSCPATEPASALEASPHQPTPWVPLEDGERTRITPLPADKSPSLSDGVQSPASGSDMGNSVNQYPYDQEQRPPTSSEYRSGTQGYESDNTNRDYGTTSSVRRPAVLLDDVYLQQGRDKSWQSEDSLSDSHQDDLYRAATPSQTQMTPYLKPIPDLKRQQRSEAAADPIPGQLDDYSDRTARRAALAPQRHSVPINWSQVDIDRQGSIKRLPVQLRQTTRQETSHLRFDDDDEGGWRRAPR